MARHARDLRLALAAMSGPDPRDPWSVPAPLQGPEVARPMRVAVTIDPAYQGVDPQVAEAVRHAATALAEAGYAVEEREPPSLLRGLERFLQLGKRTHRYRRARCAWQRSPRRGFFRCKEPCAGAANVLIGVPSHDALLERLELAHAWAMFHANSPLILGPVDRPTL